MPPEAHSCKMVSFVVISPKAALMAAFCGRLGSVAGNRAAVNLAKCDPSCSISYIFWHLGQ